MQANRPSRREIAGRSVRWDNANAQSAYENGWWVNETLGNVLARSAEITPHRILIVDGDLRLTLRSIWRQARSLASELLKRAPPGSVISFMLPNWHEAVIVYHAITLAGMVAHPVLPSLREHELSFMLADANSRMIFVPSNFKGYDYPALVERVLPLLDNPPEIVVVRGHPGQHTAYTALVESAQTSSLPMVDPNAVRIILYTSGTTGSSKGVLHSHNSIHALMRQIARHWLIEPGDCFLVPSPISHIGGSIYAFEAPLLLGTTAVLMDRWDPNVALAMACAERCTHICGATPFLEQLLREARAVGERLPHLKLFVCGGAAVQPQLIRSAAEQFSSAVITRVYGSTEVPVTTVGCVNREDLAHAAETDGCVGIAQVRLSGVPQASPGEGEILVRGPQMLVGYLRPEHEAVAFDNEGFFRTGDIGRWVDDRYLIVEGRSKDIIIRNGENISPREIEEILSAHPDVAEVAVVGVPDARTGERACAVIVPVATTAPDVMDIRKFLSAKGLAAFKHPEQIEHWPALPKSETGKVLKHRIRAALNDSQDQQ